MGISEKTFRPNKVTLLTILLASTVIVMGAAAVAPALRPISEAFPEASDLMISLVITLPALSVAITGFGVGYLADRFGKAKVFIAALAIFSIAGVSGYFSNSFEAMLLGRFILGVGITGISLTTTAMIGEYWSGMDRAKVIGYQSAAIGLGTLFLETMGGALADIGWREPFLIYLIGLPIIVLGLFSIRSPKRQTEEHDIIQDIKIPNRGRKILLCYVMMFGAMFLMFALPTNFSYYITEVGGNLTMCGLLLGVMGTAQAVFTLIYTRRSNKLSEHMAYAVSFLMMSAGLALLYVPELPATFLSMLLVGFSLGLMMPTVVGQLSMYSTSKTSGKVMGGYSVAMNLATFTSGLAVTSVVGAVGSYQDTFLILAAVSAIAFVVCLIIRSVSRTSMRVADMTEQQVMIEPETDYSQMYRSILVAVDGSADSDYAAAKAVGIAKKNGSSLTALYVFDTERYSNISGNVFSLDELAKMSEPLSSEAFAYVNELSEANGVVLTTKIAYGHPADGIILESKDHDLVVCGSVGRTGLSKAVMGSVAEKVARSSYAPVLIVRRHER